MFVVGSYSNSFQYGVDENVGTALLCGIAVTCCANHLTVFQLFSEGKLTVSATNEIRKITFGKNSPSVVEKHPKWSLVFTAGF